MRGLRKILREIHRRSLWQVLGIYLIGSWAVLEAVEAVTRFAGLPEWTPVFAFVLLLVGLPVVTLTAYFQGGLPNRGGAYRDEVDPNELEGRTPDQVHVKPKARRRRRERIFTWRNAVLGGVGAGTLLVASVIAYVGMWAAGVGPMGNLVAQGVLSPGDVVVLADFRDATGEELGAVVTQALLVDLSQTRMLRVVSGAGMGPEREPLSPDLVPEAAGRLGIKAVLEGEVAPEDDGYRLTAALREVGSGRTMASFRSAAEAPDDVIRAIDRLSQDIREKSGESPRDIRAGRPLEAVTTESLDALRLYAQAERALGRGEESRAVELLNRSVALDPAFALAWHRLAQAYDGPVPAPGRAAEAAAQAYRNRARLTERERYLAEALYHQRVVRDRARAVAAYQGALELDPDDGAALNGLAGVYQSVEDFERAGELYRRAVDGPGRSATAFRSLIRNRISMARFAEVAGVLEEYEAAFPDDAHLWEGRFWSAFVVGDMAAAEEQARPVASDPARPARVRAMALDHLGQVAYWRGRLDEGRRHLLDAERVGAEVGPSFAWVRRLWTAWAEQAVGDGAWGLEHTRSGMADGTFDAVAPTERAHWLLGVTLAFGGDGEGVTRVVSDLETSFPDSLRGPEDRLNMERLRILAGTIAGGREGILQELEARDSESGCATGLCNDAVLAWAAERVGDLSRAVEINEAIRQRGYFLPEMNGPHRLRATLRLGPLYEEVGDDARAVEAYRRLVDQWVDADARGREVVAAARARMVALAPGGG